MLKPFYDQQYRIVKGSKAPWLGVLESDMLFMGMMVPSLNSFVTLQMSFNLYESIFHIYKI